MSTEVSLLAAFVAGVLSISSPCVLPLVPIYMAHLAGVTSAPGTVPNRPRIMASAVAYVLGFSLVFVLLDLFHVLDFRHGNVLGGREHRLARGAADHHASSR